MVRFCKYYLKLIPEICKTAATWRGMWVMLILLAASILLFFNQTLGQQVIKDYDGISWKWAFVFIALSLVTAFLKINFNNHRDLENDNVRLTTENNDLKKIDLDIEYSGVPPHKDFVLDIDTFRVAVRSKSKTIDLKLVNLFLVDVTSIAGWNHNVGERYLRQGDDNPADGRPFKQDATLTPEQSIDYEFISRWREPRAEISLHYAAPGLGSIPRGQYRITLKATASNCRAVFRQFLVNVDSRERLTIEPFPSYVKARGHPLAGRLQEARPFP